MASAISWRKLAEYNKNGDMYLLILLDAMWMNKKMKSLRPTQKMKISGRHFVDHDSNGCVIFNGGVDVFLISGGAAVTKN